MRIAVIGLLIAGCAVGPTSSAPSGAATPTPTPTPSAATASGPASPAAVASEAPDEPLAWVEGPAAPDPLTEVATAAHDGRVWIAGGLRGDGAATDATVVFDPATGAWADGPRLPEKVHHAALVSDGTALWLLGGYVGNSFDTPTDAVHRLEPTPRGGGAWTTVAPLPERRAAGAAAVERSGRILYGGGVGPAGVSELVFAGGIHGFEPIARLSEAREHLAATTDGSGRVWFLGGRRDGLSGNMARVDLVVDGMLTALDDVLTPRGGVAAFVWPSVGPCLVGGESPDGTNPQVECLDGSGAAVIGPPLQVPRHGLGAAVVDGVVYVVLGGTEPGLTVSATVETLTLPGSS